MNLEQALIQPAFDLHTVLHRSNKPTTIDAGMSYEGFPPLPHTLDVTNYPFMWFYRYHPPQEFPPQLRFEFREKDLLAQGFDRVALWVITCLKTLGRQRPEIGCDERRLGKFRQDHPRPHLMADFLFTHRVPNSPFINETVFAVVQVKSVGSLDRDFWNGRGAQREANVDMTREFVAWVNFLLSVCQITMLIWV